MPTPHVGTVRATSSSDPPDAYADPDPAGPRRVDADGVLEAAFREHYTSLVALARLLIDRQSEAEELVQEAFARTYAAWPRLRDRDNLLPYLRRAVVNLCRGSLRRRATVRHAPVERERVEPGADHTVLLNAQQAAVVRALRTLPDRQRECVVLRYLLDCSTAEAADALDLSLIHISEPTRPY